MRLPYVSARIRRGPGLVIAILVLVVGAVVVAGTTAASAGPGPSLAVPAAAARPGPAPHILDFARGLRGARLKLPSGPHHVSVAWNVDGCDHDYGAVSQCVPWTIPTSAGHGCQWLAAHGFGLLKVHGRDRLGLDTNHDGTACDHGDAGT
jgi:hypothetical protein